MQPDVYTRGSTGRRRAPSQGAFGARPPVLAGRPARSSSRSASRSSSRTALCATLAVLAAAAHTRSAAARTLTLAQALVLAEERNERIAIAAESVERARLRLEGAWARLTPTLTADATLRFTDGRIEVPGDDGPRVVQEDVAAAVGGRASMTLFDARTVPGILEAEQGTKVLEASAAVERFDLLYATVEAYLFVAVAQNALRAARQSVETAREVHRITSALVEAGRALPVDILRAEVQITRATGDEIAAEAVLTDSRVYLQFLIDEEEPPTAAEGIEGLEAIERDAAPPRRPDLVLSSERLELARTAAGWDWMTFLPELVLDARYEFANQTDVRGTNHDAWVELGLRWDFFYWQRYIDLATNDSFARQAELELQLADRTASYEVTAAHERLRAAEAALTTARRRAELALTVREQVALAFAAGRASALDLLTSEDELQQARIDEIAEELELAHARISVMRARGVDPAGNQGPR